MSTFFTNNKQPFNVQFCPVKPFSVALVANENNGIFGKGSILILSLHHNGIIQEMVQDWPNALFDLQWSSTSNIVLTGSGDGTLQLWNLDQNKLVSTLSGHMQEVSSVDWKTEHQALSASWDGKLKLWNSETCTCIVTLGAHSRRIYDAQFSVRLPSLFSSVGSEGTLQLWTLSTPQPLATIKAHDAEVLSTDWNLHNDFLLVTSASDCLVRCWDIRNYNKGPVSQFRGGEKAVRKVRFSPHFSHIVAAASFDGTTQIYDAILGKNIENFRHHSGFVCGLDWSQLELGQLVDCGWDSSVVLFNSKISQILKNKI